MEAQNINYDLFGNVVNPPKTRVEKEIVEKVKATRHEMERSIMQIATIETVAKFKNQSITQVDVYRREANAPLVNPKAKENLLSQNGNDNSYNGYLSPATRRYVEQLMSVWLTSVEINADIKASKKEVNGKKVFPTFVTLTLPSTQLHSDNDIKAKILNPFIKWLTSDSSEVYKKGPKAGQRKGFGVSVYFWRAEPQKNTRIHFHIICDKYVPWEAIREKWNSCCEILGYVTRYGHVKRGRHANGFVPDKAELANDLAEYRDLAKEVLKKGAEIPENIPVLLKRHLEVAKKFNKTISDANLELCAIARQEATYEKGKACNFTNPPSTEIRAIRHLDSVAAYVIKYVAKKPTEKALKPNQFVKLNESENRLYVTTMDYNYVNTIGEIEPIIVNSEPYKPQYEERKINGRIWGCSDTLRGFKAAEDQEVVTDDIGRTYVKDLITTDTDGNTAENLIPVPVMKYFTKTLSERYVILSSDEKGQNVFVSSPQNVDYTTTKYIDKMVDFIGKETVDAISAKVGTSFRKMHGKIIPFRTEKMGYPNRKNKKGESKPAVVKHSQILRDHSPELYRQYIAYYKHVFDCLYTDVA